MHRKLICAFLLFLLPPSVCPHLLADEAPIDADVLLVGGTIHDGTGEAPKMGDVAIRGDKIVAGTPAIAS